jgi:hypothetical protein
MSLLRSRPPGSDISTVTELIEGRASVLAVRRVAPVLRPLRVVTRSPGRINALFAEDAHVEVEATWGVYQGMVAAYRHEDRRQGRELMVKLIDSISSGVPKALTEIVTLGRTLKKRAADVLAYFDRPGTSNRPTEALNGRLEHLRGSALGFRNLTDYIVRSLLETGGFRPQLHPRMG